MPQTVILALWGFHLIYPAHFLQHRVWMLFGYPVPIYYFFVALPIIGAVLVHLSLNSDWSRWEVLWWTLPLICLPAILFSGDRVWSIRQWLSWIIRGVIPGGILLGARTRRPEVFLANWIYPIIIAASAVGSLEIYFREIHPTDKNLWNNYLVHIQLDASRSGNNPFYRPYDSRYEVPLSVSSIPGGTQGNRLVYASTLVGFIPFGLWRLKYRKKFFRLELAGFGLLASILLLAQARGAWIGALAALMSSRMIGLKLERRQVVQVAAVALFFVGCVLVWPRARPTLWQRINSFHVSDMSIHARLGALRSAKILKSRGFFGVGFGLFPTACGSYFPAGSSLMEKTSDNQYLRWAIENGVPSLVLLLVFFIGLGRAADARIRTIEDRYQADFYRALFSGWVGIGATFLFFDGFYWGAACMTFWCLLGLFANCLKSNIFEI